MPWDDVEFSNNNNNNNNNNYTEIYDLVFPLVYSDKSASNQKRLSDLKTVGVVGPKRRIEGIVLGIYV